MNKNIAIMQLEVKVHTFQAQLWPFSKFKFNRKSDRVNLVTPASPTECRVSYWCKCLLYTQCPGDTVQTIERLTRLGNSNVLRLPIIFSENTSNTENVMQGKLIAVAYTLRTYWNQFSLGGIFHWFFLCVRRIPCHVRLRHPSCVYITAQRQYTAVQKMRTPLK